MKSNVFTLAWNLVKSTGLSLADALRRAWHTVKLTAKMAVSDERGVMFRYTKEDGTERWAMGTRNPAYTPATKGTGSASSVLAVKYFDILANGWRSFRADRLIIEQA